MNINKRAKVRSVQIPSNIKQKVPPKTNLITTTTTMVEDNTNNKKEDIPSVIDIKSHRALLVIGTYHSVMAGLIYRRDKFSILFSIKHHEGCINSVAVGEKYMVSSGTDERIFLFTNKHKKNPLLLLSTYTQEQLSTKGKQSSLSIRLADLGHISPPNEVRYLLLTPNSQYMLCGCINGQFIVYSTRDWSIHLSLFIHEKSIEYIALHPHSEGTLAITIGADRHVAVMDLAKGRLLSKWRYNSSLIMEETKEKKKKDNNTNANNEEEEGEEEENNNLRHMKRLKLERRDIPRAVKFSPSGKYFTIISSHMFAVYETARMCLVGRYQSPSPQPCDEIHVFTFIDDNTMIFGNESGKLLSCCGPWGTDDTQPKECILRQIVMHMSTEHMENEKQSERHPTHHTARLKAIYCMERTVFSLDAKGIVIAWHVEEVMDSGMTLKYVCSANCQGRVTTMDVLPL